MITSLHFVVLPVWLAASWVFLVAVASGPVSVAIGVVSAGLALAGGLMAIAHDQLHRHGTRQTRWFRILLAHLVPAGLCDVWWVDKHNGSHHRATGVHGHDTDLDYGQLLRLSESQQWRAWHRYQRIYAPLLYPFAHLAMVLAQWRYLLTGRLSNGKPATGKSSARWFGVCLAVLPPLVWIGVAAAFRPVVPVLLATGGVVLVSGLTLAAVFQIEHQVDSVIAPHFDEEGRVVVDWSTSQLLATANVATHRQLTTFYLGALNHHIEHHLFPGVAVADLPRLSVIVRQTAAEFDLPRVEYRSFTAAWADHLRFLGRMGQPPATVAQRQSSRSTDASAALAAS